MSSAIVLAVVYVLVLAVVNMQIVEYLKRPIRAQCPEVPLWWVLYVAFVSGVGLAFGFRLDAFEFMPPHPFWLGCLLTGCMVGGGSSLIFDTTSEFVAGLTQLKSTLTELTAILEQARGVMSPSDIAPAPPMGGFGAAVMDAGRALSE